MGTLDLRPLSVGELLDRTFSLYRQNFLLFFGISAIPHLLVLAVQLTQLAVTKSRFPFAPDLSTDFQRVSPDFSASTLLTWAAFVVAAAVVGVIAYLFS